MSTLIIKLLGTTVLGAVASVTVGMVALDVAPAGMPDWTKASWARIAALDTGTKREAAKPEGAPADPEQIPKEVLSDRPAAPEIGQASPPSVAADDKSAGPIRIGDKLKIGFYERMESEEEKWGKQRSLRPAFQQRMELSGDYTVNDEGMISVPLVGSFPVTKRSVQKLEVALANAAQAVTGRKGFVTIAAVEQQPVYILGPVKNPGAYKYAPGMTVLHAVALAGGLERAPTDPWQRIEAVRETGKRHGAIERLTRLMARVAVLKSEHAQSQPQVPIGLARMVGNEAANGAVREQIDRRQSAVWMRNIRQSAAGTAVENAKREVETLSGAVLPIDENIKLRAGRLESLRSLKNSNIVSNPVFIQAQSELSDVQERRQAAVNAVGLAKYRFAVAEQESARLQAETQVALEQEISAAEQDIADVERELGSSEGVLTVVHAGAMRRDVPTGETSLAYEIVRQSPQGAITISSLPTANLEPGDLVRVHPRFESEAGTTEARLPR
jgi:protein involved in polysaccharide export with SLBB domain